MVIKAVAEGGIIGCQGEDAGKPIYKTEVNGNFVNFAVTVGGNDFVVSENSAAE